MKKCRTYISFILGAVSLLLCGEAAAISKLDFFEPVADALNVVQKYAEGSENVYIKHLEEANEMVMKVANGEGKDLFKEFVIGKASGILQDKAKGTFIFRENAEGPNQAMLESAFDVAVGDMKLDFANLKNFAEDYVRSAEQEKTDRNIAMNTELLRLQTERAALNDLAASEPSEEVGEMLERYDMQIASLQSQIQENADADVRNTAQFKEYEQKMADLQEKISQKVAETSDSVLKSLEKNILGGFLGGDISGSEQAEADGLKATYERARKNLFYSDETAEKGKAKEQLALVKQHRKSEYYQAVSNLMAVSVNTHRSIDEIENNIINCTDAAYKAQGVFGASAMRLCVDIQKAKAAAQYLELQIAQMRFDAARDIQSWNDKYTAPAVRAQADKFSFNDYILREEDILAE